MTITSFFFFFFFHMMFLLRSFFLEIMFFMDSTSLLIAGLPWQVPNENLCVTCFNPETSLSLSEHRLKDLYKTWIYINWFQFSLKLIQVVHWIQLPQAIASSRNLRCSHSHRSTPWGLCLETAPLVQGSERLEKCDKSHLGFSSLCFKWIQSWLMSQILLNRRFARNR